MRNFFLRILFSSFFLRAVSGGEAWCQNIQSLDTVKPIGEYENIYTRLIYSDSLSSSFVIFIKKEVKLHKHVTHTEQVYILDGEGQMQVGDKTIQVKKGDMISISKNTPHSLKVTSAIPVKALSVQAPFFDGKDRIMLEAPVPISGK